MSKTLKNILIVILVIVVLIGAYMVFFDTNEEDQLLSSEKIGGEMESVDNSLISLLLELRSIDLEDSIFKSGAFQGLLDFGMEIESQSIGRNNPFSPIGEDFEESKETE